MKADSFKKMSALSQSSRNPGDMKVTVQTSHHLQDEDFTEIDDRNVAKGLFLALFFNFYCQLHVIVYSPAIGYSTLDKNYLKKLKSASATRETCYWKIY